MKTYAYIRVSTKEQNIDRQLMALEPYEIPLSRVFIDYQSGKNFDRPQYQRLVKKLRKGDVLVVKSIDRLGRNYTEILIQWQYITKEIAADIVVIDMPLLDTRRKTGDLTGALISDLVLQIFAYVAQTERDFIHQRQAEGITAAKARGTRFGRRPQSLPPGFDDACVKCEQQQLTTREAAQQIGMNHSTFYRRYCEWKKSKRGGKLYQKVDFLKRSSKE